MRRWEHGGAWAKWCKPYRCRICHKTAGQSLEGMEDDRICPWCAQEIGIRICEGLNEAPGLNFFASPDEYEQYRMRRNPAHIPESVRQRILKRDGGVCNHCGDASKPCVDHKVPSSRGGLPVEDNLWVLCARCNTSKRDQTVEEWLARGGRINRHSKREEAA